MYYRTVFSQEELMEYLLNFKNIPFKMAVRKFGLIKSWYFFTLPFPLSNISILTMGGSTLDLRIRRQLTSDFDV